MQNTSEIKLLVTLDENKIPEKISWLAEQAGVEGEKESLAMLLTLWDKDEKVTMGLDLWTKEMSVDDMNILFHQNFYKLADTYGRATNNEEVADLIRTFGDEFAKKSGLAEK